MINSEQTGLAAERVERMRGLLRARGVARVEELGAELGVSAATVRRDLLRIEREGAVRRVHGGAVWIERRLEEPVFDDKAAIAAEQKQRIAEKAAGFIKPSDCIFLDGGSTVLALARLLLDMAQLTVVTNSLRVAGLMSAQGPRTILVGGELRRLSQTFVGSLTAALIDKLHVDAAFMGTIGLSQAEGLTTTDPREAYTKELIMAHAQQTILLADSSKIGQVSFVRFGTPADVDVLITDKQARTREVRKLRKRGMRVVTV